MSNNKKKYIKLEVGKHIELCSEMFYLQKICLGFIWFYVLDRNGEPIYDLLVCKEKLMIDSEILLITELTESHATIEVMQVESDSKYESEK